MQRSKTYSALSLFDKYEQNRLRKYIISPYFNKNEGIIHLYEILIKNINKNIKVNTSKELSKEFIWSKIYSDKAYDDIRFRKLNSDLLKLVEGFLAQQIFDENPLHQASYLIEAVGRRRLTKAYNTAEKTARRLSEQQELKHANFYYYQYEIEKNISKIEDNKFKRNERKNLEEIAKNLDRFYLAEKLKNYCSVLNDTKFIAHEYNLLFMNEIIAHTEKFKYEDVPPISIYYQIYLTQTSPEVEKHYFKLKELLKENGLLFPIDEAEVIYNFAMNYCIRKGNQGKSNFVLELYDVYNDYLIKVVKRWNGELAPWHFKNIVTVATRLEKYEWTEKFIADYKDKLPDEFRENAISFNLARLYFSQKKYDEVISMLREVEYEDISYNVSSKALLVKTFYEKDEIEILFSISDSFRVFLQRQKNIPPLWRQNYLNLIKFTKKLAKLIPSDKKSLQKIKDEIEKTDKGAIEPWILEKIKEIEEK